VGRDISIELQAHLDSGRTTTTYVIEIIPKDPAFPRFGASMTNRDILFDGLLYLAAVGVTPSDVLTSAGLDVDNAEAQHLLPTFDFPISERNVQAGVYDYAGFVVRLLNYQDTSIGAVEILRGELGQMKTVDGLSFWTEWRGLQQKLKQSVCPRDSIACRATFGSQPKGTGGGVVEEIQPCGIDLGPLWAAGTVTAVGAEAGYSFTDASLPFPGAAADGVYKLGMVRWTSGANTGRESEVEWNTAAGRVDLAFPTGFPIEIGDEFEIREGCNKIARDDSHGCKRWWGPQWTQHFNGEPDIPIGDAVRNATPGANSGPGSGGSSNIPYDDLAA